MDTSSQVEQQAVPPVSQHGGRDGQSGEGARSVMEQLMQQERQRAAQREAEAGVSVAPAEAPGA
jgi:hypothetical protein